MAKSEGVRFRCITCRAERTLSLSEVEHHGNEESVPTCEKDGSPMVAFEVTVRRLGRS